MAGLMVADGMMLAIERLQDYTCKQISFSPKVIRLRISKQEL